MLFDILLILHFICAFICIVFWLFLFERNKVTVKQHVFVILGSLLFGSIFLISIVLILTLMNIILSE